MCGAKSATIKSYVSAIKYVLKAVDYDVKDEKVMLSTMVGTCRMENDVILNRLPIQSNLLEQLLFQIERKYSGDHPQPFLEFLFKTAFIFMYYGMLRIGEVARAEGGHTLRAPNVHFGQNKDKILIVLNSSKTHGKRHHPQKIRITANNNTRNLWKNKKHFCPFEIANTYSNIRGGYINEQEQYFIFADHSPLTSRALRRELKEALTRIGLDAKNYDTHSFRVGRATDLQKMQFPLDKIKQIGRWRSNAVYNYLRN